VVVVVVQTDKKSAIQRFGWTKEASALPSHDDILPDELELPSDINQEIGV
jgi:hypothetical protein